MRARLALLCAAAGVDYAELTARPGAADAAVANASRTGVVLVRGVPRAADWLAELTNLLL